MNMSESVRRIGCIGSELMVSGMRLEYEVAWSASSWIDERLSSTRGRYIALKEVEVQCKVRSEWIVVGNLLLREIL